VSGGPLLDDAAWSSTWRDRATGDKVLLCLGLLACGVGLPAWPAAPLVTIASLVLLLGPAGVPARVPIRVGLALGGFLLLGAVSLAVTIDTPTDRHDLWLHWAGFAVTHTTLAHAAATTAHSVAGTSAMILLGATTPMSRLLRWAGRHGVPAPIVEIADLTYRFVFLLLDTVRAVHEAQAARLGYRDRRTMLRSSAQLAAVVLVRSWDRARRLQDGLDGRGFDGTITVLDHPGHRSARFLAGSALLIVTVVTTGLLGS
jgi:cobalt/nickel transport system permease protein